jgi:transposase
MMDKDERRAAKAAMIAHMIQGRPWVDAVRDAGLDYRRAGAYRLLHEVRRRGDAALDDGRHGHAAKLRAPVRAWLAEYCRGTPAASGPAVQAALSARFGLDVSVSQINRVRVALGLGRSAGGAGKKSGPV